MAEFHELVFEGSLPVVRAFLAGLRHGKGWSAPAIVSEDCDIRGESLGHKVLEKIRLTKDLTYVVVSERQVPVITAAAREAQAELGLAIRRDKVVREACFDYAFHIFDRRAAGRLRQLFATAPAGIERTDVEEGEAVRPTGKGVEVYTPEHEFEFKGRGVVRGPIEAVLDYRRSLQRIEQLSAEKIQLVLGSGQGR